VEAVFEGEADKVEKMIEWCREGSPMSRVVSVEVLEEVYTGDFNRLAVSH
jgi:acylphosphatase